jgi:putative chitinase
MPGAGQRIPLFVDPLNAAMEEFEINTAQRQAAFIAQIAYGDRLAFYSRAQETLA